MCICICICVIIIIIIITIIMIIISSRSKSPRPAEAKPGDPQQAVGRRQTLRGELRGNHLSGVSNPVWLR